MNVFAAAKLQIISGFLKVAVLKSFKIILYVVVRLIRLVSLLELGIRKGVKSY
ncbi:MAG: hypothetical protein WCS17_08580 [Prevotella sp.]